MEQLQLQYHYHQQLPNTMYELIGLIINKLKAQITITDEQKIEAVEILEVQPLETLEHIYITTDLDWLICLIRIDEYDNNEDDE